jgi:hypothetical protein
MIKVGKEEKKEKLLKVTKVRERGSCLGKSNVETDTDPCLSLLPFTASCDLNPKPLLSNGAGPCL